MIAQTERATRGFARIIVKDNGEISAPSSSAPCGEMIAAIGLAMANRLKISAFAAGFVPAYPTRMEILKRVAGQFYTERLFSTRTRTFIRWLARLPN